jgi:hypothetical protein
MTATEIGILVTGAFGGWWIVSYLFDRRSGGVAPPAGEGTDGPGERAATQATAAAPVSNALSLADLGARWHEILGTTRDADAATLEQAYGARRRAIDARRFAQSVTAAERQAAEEELRVLEDAYAFARSLRG